MKLDTLNELLQDIDWLVEMVETYWDIWIETEPDTTIEDIRDAYSISDQYIMVNVQDFAYNRINEGEGIEE